MRDRGQGVRDGKTLVSFYNVCSFLSIGLAQLATFSLSYADTDDDLQKIPTLRCVGIWIPPMTYQHVAPVVTADALYLHKPCHKPS